MAYTYIIRFQIDADRISELQIGSSLERVLGYLRTLLPSQDGFITSRALYSLENEEKVGVLFESVWDTWESIQAHRESNLSEDKVLLEFGDHVDRQGLDIRVYQEIE